MRITLLATMLIAASGAAHAAQPAQAQAAPKVCKLAIAGNDAMQYDKKELKVPADCGMVELTLTHTGKLPVQAMGHNWVLVKSAADANAVASAGTAAGLKNGYLPPGDKRVIASTRLLGGGEKDTIKFPTGKLKKGEAYTYVCTFPGHSALMKGTLTFG